MKIKTIYLIAVLAALSVRGFAQTEAGAPPASERDVVFWLQNADSVICRGGTDTVSLAFFNTTQTSFHSSIPFTNFTEVWVVLQHNSWEPYAWKITSEALPAGLVSLIQKRGSGTRVTVSVKPEPGFAAKGYATAFYIK